MSLYYKTNKINKVLTREKTFLFALTARKMTSVINLHIVQSSF